MLHKYKNFIHFRKVSEKCERSTLKQLYSSQPGFIHKCLFVFNFNGFTQWGALVKFIQVNPVCILWYKLQVVDSCYHFYVVVFSIQGNLQVPYLKRG